MRLGVALVVLAGCGRVAFDPAGDAACDVSWFVDADGDGHGDPATTTRACTQPAGRVALGDDCDDVDRHRYPGAAEICDGVDNDCVPATLEDCPAGCSVVRRPAPDDAHAYLVCRSTFDWNDALTACRAEGYELVRLDDAAENTWLRATGNTEIGFTPFWIGATDAVVEGSWVWSDGTPFWQGTGSGTSLGGLYAEWDGAEPNDLDGVEDCAVMDAHGPWNDVSCLFTNPYVCERD